ncbi:MAG: phosphatase PAP2 family protein [Bacteroidales bacterium]
MENEKRRGVDLYLSQGLSVLFHPAFLPVYGLLLIFNAPTFMVHLPYDIKRIIFLMATVNMTVVPLALMPLLKYRNMITSYGMETTRERVIPLTLGVMMYTVTTIIFFTYQIPVLIKSFMLASTVTSFIILVITFRWKISIHSAGMGGLLATAMALSVRMNADLRWVVMAIIFLSGVVMASRLYLRVHTPAQVYTGFVAGFTVFMIVMTMF